ncbi:hypothetical protein ACFLZN_00125 [Nanoarchaeota archaeon]
MKKANITLWIALGIIVFFIVIGLIYFITSYEAPKKADVAIRNYVESCITETALEGLEIIGERGGYVDPLDPEYTRKNFDLGVASTEGDVLQIDGITLPYWWYMKGSNDCANCIVTRENKPTLRNIEEQLELYLKNTLPFCNEGFRSYIEEGYYIRGEDINAKVEFSDTEVIIDVNWPLSVKDAGGGQIRLNDFHTEIDIPMKNIYLLADEIVEFNVETQRLDDVIVHLITAFSDLKHEKLPPTAAITHVPYVVTWSKQLVGININSILLQFISLIQIDKTRNANRIVISSGPEQGVYDALYLKFLEENYPFEVGLAYLDWGMYFDISPNVDGSLNPEVHFTSFPEDIAPPIVTNYYEFFYDVSVPILITIRDPEANNGKGYNFIFPIELNIRDNKNLKSWNEGLGTIGPWSSTVVTGTSTYTETKAGECYCEANGKKLNFTECSGKNLICSLDKTEHNNLSSCIMNCIETSEPIIHDENFTENFFCQPEFAQSDIVTIKVFDDYAGNVMKDATVSYGCGSFAVCKLGATDRRGIVRTKLPFCFNGHVKVHKKDYHSETQLLTPEVGERAYLNFSLKEKRSLRVNISVQEIEVLSVSGLIGQDPPLEEKRDCCEESSLTKDETIMVNIERVKENDYETSLVQILSAEGNSKQTIELIPGNYSIRAQLMDDKGFILFSRCMRVGTSLLPDKDVIMKPGLRGGVEIGETTGYFEITKEDLVNASVLNLGVFRIPAPVCVSESLCIIPDCIGIEELDRLKDYTKMYYDEVKPELV